MIDARYSLKSHPTPLILPCRLKLKNKEGNIVPHGKNKKKTFGYIRCDELKVSEFRIRNAYMYYNPKNDIYNMYTCHIRVTQSLAWVRVALPSGLVCHVAFMCVPRENKPLFSLFNSF